MGRFVEKNRHTRSHASLGEEERRGKKKLEGTLTNNGFAGLSMCEK